MDLQLSTRTKVIISVVVVLGAFATGRYSANSPTVKTDIKTDTDTQAQRDTHKTTVITEDPKTKNKTITITEDTIVNTQTVAKTDDKTTVTASKSIINISALAGLDTSRGFVPVYGLSANKELIGPITVGAFGLTNGVIGVSVGFNF